MKRGVLTLYKIRPHVSSVLATVAVLSAAIVIFHVSVPLPVLFRAFAACVEIFFPSEAVSVHLSALPPSVKTSVLAARLSMDVSTLVRNLPDIAPATNVLPFASAARMIWSPAFSVEASVTSVALLVSGSSAIACMGRIDSTMTRASSSARSLPCMPFFMNIPPLTFPREVPTTGGRVQHFCRQTPDGAYFPY